MSAGVSIETNCDVSRPEGLIKYRSMAWELLGHIIVMCEKIKIYQTNLVQKIKNGHHLCICHTQLVPVRVGGMVCYLVTHGGGKIYMEN